MSGQTISDRLLAARHSIAGQGLAKSVCKATTEEVIGPKKKHLDYLLHCTNEPNVSIPQLANLLIERSQNSNWVVVFKSLVTTHHLMCYGNERFTQYLASSNCSFQLGNFLDKGNVAGYDMSPYIRRYAKYLNEKALAYRTVAFDFCKVKRGKEDGILRTMAADKLLKTIPVLQAQVDALLEFDCSADDLTNGVVNTAFLLLFRDLIRLFACYNDGIINLLEKYFDMNKKQCKDALDFYKRFLVRMDRVAEFLKVAENVGIDKGDIPDLTKAPSSLLEALEAHLATLEGRKPASSSSNISLAQHNGAMAANAEQIDESLKRQALAEEEFAMNQYKKSTNPFLSSPTAAAPATSVGAATAAPPVAAAIAAPAHQPFLDFFGEELDGSTSNGAASNSQPTQKASDDLLQLAANPFASPTAAPPAIPPLPTNSWSGVGVQNGTGFTSQFASDNSFATVFGNGTSQPANAAAAANPFGSSLHSSPSHHQSVPPRPPPPTGAGGAAGGAAGGGFDAFGDLLQPAANVVPNAAPNMNVSTNKVLTGDLESSLASLAQNLTINKTQTSKNQWSGVTKPGGNANVMAGAGVPTQQWAAQPMMGVSMTSAPMSGMQGQMAFRPMVPINANPMVPIGAMTAPFASSQPMNPMMASGIRPAGATPPFQMGAMTQPMTTGSAPMTGMRPTANQLDPFGAL